MHALIAYPEKVQRHLLHTLLSYTDLAKRLTGLENAEPVIDKDPFGGLFAFSYTTLNDKMVYIYFRASTFGSPKTEYEQIREQASFMHRHPDAYYFALILREAWFEWPEGYVERRLGLPLRRLGYETLVPALEGLRLTQLPDSIRSEIQAYQRHLQKEYEGILHPVRLPELRLRQYAVLWHIRRAFMSRWASSENALIEWDIRTQPHVHSSHLDQVFLRQYPPHRLHMESYELSLFWELEREGLFLRVGLPPMREKIARAVHHHLRKQAQLCAAEYFALGRTRGTLKGIDTYHAREVNLLRIEVPELQQLIEMREAETFHVLSDEVAEDLAVAVGLLPEISKRVGGVSVSIR
ncbi:MAG: hypothetical protein N3E49_05340 [Bacteroidia bacterium]|nr:hypothetical protein [Bacteroidia bacterium]